MESTGPALSAKRTNDGGCLLQDGVQEWRLTEQEWAKLVASTAVDNGGDVAQAVVLLLRGQSKVHVSVNGKEVAELALETATGIVTPQPERLAKPVLALPRR